MTFRQLEDEMAGIFNVNRPKMTKSLEISTQIF